MHIFSLSRLKSRETEQLSQWLNSLHKKSAKHDFLQTFCLSQETGSHWSQFYIARVIRLHTVFH